MRDADRPQRVAGCRRAAARRRGSGHSPAAFSSSFGAEDMVVLDLIARHALPIHIFTLDTGRLPEETHALIDRVREHYGLPIDVYAPDARLAGAFVARARHRRVLRRRRAAQGLLRRAQGRAAAPRAGRARARGSPACAARSRSRARRSPIEESDAAHALGSSIRSPTGATTTSGATCAPTTCPYNALHDRGYPSIGCEPCTRAVAPGEDLRAGRWWWEQPAHKECGLHRRSIPIVAKRHDPAGRGGDAVSEALDAEHAARRGEPAAPAAPITSTGSSRSRSTSCARWRASAGNPALLFSGGKDSIVMLRLAEKAFRPGAASVPACCTSTPSTISRK